MTGFCVETLALSVFNLLSRARGPLSASAIHQMLSQPHVWDPRVTTAEVESGARYLVKHGWAVETADVFDLTDRHPMTKLGRDVVRDPLDAQGKRLLMLGAYQ